MAVSWLTALKVIPWGDVIEHAPAVLKGARRLLDRQSKPAAGVPATGEPQADLPGLQLRLQQLEQQHAADMAQLSQMVADLAEQNARLVAAVELLRLRTRWLLAVTAVLTVALAALAFWGR